MRPPGPRVERHGWPHPDNDGIGVCHPGVGSVSSTVAARRRVHRLNPRPLAGMAEWAARQQRFWNHRIDALEQHLLDHDKEHEG